MIHSFSPSRSFVWVAFLLILLLPRTALAVDREAEPDPLTVSLGTVLTEAEEAAVRFFLSYSKTISGNEFQNNFKNGLIYFTPDVHIETGEADAFNSVVAKITGNILFFNTTIVSGVETPNTDFLHALPISAGAEADRAFQNVNVLIEAGYVPWFQGALPRKLSSLRVGVFLQSGYKAHIDSTGAQSGPSGAVDESKESPDAWLFRGKASIRFSPELVLDAKRGWGFGIRGQADGWRDIANGAWYHRLEGAFRIRLAPSRYFELSYQDGSGAPNFNKGNQFSANLAVSF